MKVISEFEDGCNNFTEWVELICRNYFAAYGPFSVKIFECCLEKNKYELAETFATWLKKQRNGITEAMIYAIENHSLAVFAFLLETSVELNSFLPIKKTLEKNHLRYALGLALKTKPLPTKTEYLTYFRRISTRELCPSSLFKLIIGYCDEADMEDAKKLTDDVSGPLKEILN